MKSESKIKINMWPSSAKAEACHNKKINKNEIDCRGLAVPKPRCAIIKKIKEKAI